MSRQLAKQLLGIAGIVLATVGLATGYQWYSEGRLFAPEWEKDFRLAMRLAEIRTATARYRDVEQAKADGYQQISGNAPLEGYHFHKAEITEFDYNRPSTLLYIRANEEWQLVGLQYALPGERPAETPFPGIGWKRRLALCRYADWQEWSSPTAEQCPPVHPATQSQFVAWSPDLWVIDLWLWHPNPKGLFAVLNPLLAPYDDRTIPPGERRTWAEFQESADFSTWNHNFSGWLVLVLGLGVAVSMASSEQRSKIRLLWPLVAVVLAVFILIRSDPEFWPLGDHSLLETLGEREAIEHKLSGFLVLALGTVEWLRARGTLSHWAWGMVLPWLAITGGSILLFHVHEDINFNYLGRINQPHITEGITAIAVGVTYLLADWRVVRQRFWRVVPGALIILMAAQLILYVE